VCLIAVALVLPSWATAQEEDYQQGNKSYIIHNTVNPADAAQFEAAIGKLAEAAKLANLGADYTWYVFNDMFDYTIVLPFEEFAMWDDPSRQMVRQFAGTPGEALAQEAFAAFSEVSGVSGSSEVVISVPAWTYMPTVTDGPTELGFVHVDEQWIQSQDEGSYSKLAEQYLKLCESVGYPYQIIGHNTLFGETRKMLVTFIDDLGSYYGSNNLPSLLAEKGRSAEYAELMQNWSSIAVRHKHYNLRYRSELSYDPEM
jgi:hypothetical protein